MGLCVKMFDLEVRKGEVGSGLRSQKVEDLNEKMNLYLIQI